MQLIKPSKSIMIIGSALIIACTWLWYHYLELTPYLAYVNWLAVAIVVIIIFSRLGNIKLQTQATTKQHTHGKPLQFWQLQISVGILQVCLAGLLYSIYTLFNHIFIPSGAVTHTTFIGQQYLQLTHYGLFPWPVIALLSVFYSYTVYNKKQSASLPKLMTDNNSTYFGSTAEQIILFFARLGTTCILGCVITAAALNTAAWVLQHWQQPMPHGKTGYSLVYMLIVFILIKQKSLRNAIYNMLSKGYKSYQVIVVATAIFSCAVVGFSLLIPYLFQHNLDPGQNWLTANTWQKYWSSFSILWWLGWYAPLSLWLASKAKGFSIRSLILVQLSLPAIICAALYGWHMQHAHWMDSSSISQAISGWQALTTGFCMLLVIVIFSYQDQLSLQFENTLQADSSIKFRHAFKPTYNILLASIGISTLFLQSGFCSLSFISCVLFIPVALAIYLACIIWPVRRLLDKRSSR